MDARIQVGPTGMHARATVIDSVVAQLEVRMMSSQYLPGTKLSSEESLALEFEVSRPVIREALARLRERGYIETLNGKGTFVRGPNLDGITTSMLRHIRMHEAGGFSPGQLYEARATIEVEAAHLAALRANQADLGKLADQIAKMAAAQGDPVAYTAADVGFHVALAESTHNPLFPVMLTPLVQVIVEGMYRSVRTVERGMEAGRREHAQILSLVKAGDPDGARAAMREHMHNSRQSYEAGAAQDREAEGAGG